MDPLSLLRELTIAGRLSDVSLGPERVDVIGRGSFDRSRRTAYRSQQGAGEPYDVATIALFAKSVGLGAADYFRAAREVGVQQVAFGDRKARVWGASRMSHLSGRRSWRVHSEGEGGS